MKLLVISLAGIGDTLLASAMLRELRSVLPAARIEALVLWEGAADLLKGNPHVDRVIQRNLLRLGVLRSVAALARLRGAAYDVSLNAHTQGRVHYRIAAWLAGAPLRISHRYENHGWLDRVLVNRVVEQDYTVHTIENNRRLIDCLGQPLNPTAASPEVFLEPAERGFAAEYASIRRLDRCVVLGVHAGSGETKNLRLKRWPERHWIELLRRLVRVHPGLRVLVFGGPSEREAHERMAAALPADTVLFPRTRDLRQVAALMEHCDGFVSVDTALMHLAAAMDVTQQVVIEAPTLNPTNMPWRRERPAVVVPNPVVAGRNLEYYRYDGGPIRGTRAELERCMASVTVDAVEKTVLNVLPASPGRRPVGGGRL